MRVDLVYTQYHYLDHMLPIWNALPDELLGDVHRLGDMSVDHDRVALVAGGVDAHVLRGQCKAIYVEHGAGQCLAPGTKVLRGDLRWVDVASLNEGDEIVAFDEHSTGGNDGRRHWRRAWVLATERKTLPSYRVTLADGTEIVASNGHLWLCRTNQTMKWFRTDELQPSSVYPARSSKLAKVMDTWEEDRSWGGGYLASAFDGEGSLHQKIREGRSSRYVLNFCQKNNAMLDMVQGLLAERGFDYSIWMDAATEVWRMEMKGGIPALQRFMGQVRPLRLWDKYVPVDTGTLRSMPMEVVDCEFLGDHEVIGLATTTGTLIAEGIASHNSYGGASLAEAQNPSYSGAGSGRWPHVIGYIAPSQRVADRWAPAPAMAVGCPKMDQYMGRLNKPPGKAVCFAFHWDAAFCPEAQSTFQYWAPHMPQIVEAFNGQGYDVYGHAHPRWHGELDPSMRHQGLVVLGSDHDVFTRCDILFVDNSSLGPEFAALGRTVCWLNGPGYRRDVDHGMRFWDWAEMCPTFDGPRELVRLDLDALVAASDPCELALDAYKYVDGRSSQRAAMFVAELVRAL